VQFGGILRKMHRRFRGFRGRAGIHRSKEINPPLAISRRSDRPLLTE
jgi:hypothetical protein